MRLRWARFQLSAEAVETFPPLMLLDHTYGVFLDGVLIAEVPP